MELSSFGGARLHWFYSFIPQIVTQWLPHVTHPVEHQGHEGEDVEWGLHPFWVHSQAVETDIKCAITQIFTTVMSATRIKYKMFGETWLSLGAQGYFLGNLDKVRINTQHPHLLTLWGGTGYPKRMSPDSSDINTVIGNKEHYCLSKKACRSH